MRSSLRRSTIAGLDDAIWRAFAVLLPVQTVGVIGRWPPIWFCTGSTSVDGMIAGFYHYDTQFSAGATTRIINGVKGVNRVVYDGASKPPGTIEWEYWFSGRV